MNDEIDTHDLLAKVKQRYPWVFAPGVTLAATMAVIAQSGRPLTETAILGEFERRYGTADARKRSRSLPDTTGVIGAAVADMKKTGTRRTWANTATRISEMTGVYVAPSTLRLWCSEDKLPHPGQPYWDRPRWGRLTPS